MLKLYEPANRYSRNNRVFGNISQKSAFERENDVPCRILEGADWQLVLQNISGYILFTDEENAFIRTEQFASAVRDSDNYFVIITRESLYNLPYSVEEIYGIHSSGKYQNTKQVYQQLVPKWKSFINYHGYIEI